MAAPREEILEKLRERIAAYWTSIDGRDRAEDIAQQTIMLLISKYPHLHSEEDLVPLGIASSRRVRWSLIRKEKLDKVTPLSSTLDPQSPDEDPEGLAVRAQRQAQIEEHILTLGDRCRDIFQYLVEGFSYEETAQRMGANLDTLYVWVHRCKKKLKDCIGGAK